MKDRVMKERVTKKLLTEERVMKELVDRLRDAHAGQRLVLSVRRRLTCWLT